MKSLLDLTPTLHRVIVCNTDSLVACMHACMFASLVFHSFFVQCYPLGSSYLVRRVLGIGL